MGSMAAIREQADRDGTRSAANRETGAGIFFPLTHIRADDSQATVVIYPSDHFVHLESK
jgi:mannose-1-phosphate guanylyltransferase